MAWGWLPGGCRALNGLGFPAGDTWLVARQRAVESKPLFHPEVMRQQVGFFDLPKHVPGRKIPDAGRGLCAFV
jgi:hypothetical protein